MTETEGDEQFEALLSERADPPFNEGALGAVGSSEMPAPVKAFSKRLDYLKSSSRAK